MSKKKKEVREKFRQGVFSRDKNTCVTCKKTNTRLDAHHITDRHLMPNGGYVIENGISLCDVCHEKAEVFHSTGTPYPGFSPDELYKKINSNYELALKMDS